MEKNQITQLEKWNEFYLAKEKWKEPLTFDLLPDLRVGENQITLDIKNTRMMLSSGKAVVIL